MSFINSPEGIGKLLNYKFTGGSMTMPKYQKPPFGSIGKCHKACQTLQSADHPDFSRDRNIINTFQVIGFSGKIARL
jgi:hypothetical protein